MSKSAFTRHAADLAWSLWTELGVSGVVREHPDVEVDPEALIVATPMIVREDPRLIEQALAWCVTNQDRIATNRLEGLLRLLPPEGVVRFESFAATANALTGSRWPAGHAEVPGKLPRLKEVVPALERPSLLRLRARALCGVSARADIITELLLRPDAWHSAEDLLDSGHSKRNIARTLAELSDSGIVSSLRVGNSRRFSLARPAQLGDALGGVPEEAPRWVHIFKLVVMLSSLHAAPDPSPVMRRIAAHALWERLAPVADLLSLEPPAILRGEPEAWSILSSWGVHQLELLAIGLSPAIIGRTRSVECEIIGTIERFFEDRGEVGLRLPGERKLVRVRRPMSMELMQELYAVSDPVRIRGPGHRNLHGRLKYLESVVSIEKLAA